MTNLRETSELSRTKQPNIPLIFPNGAKELFDTYATKPIESSEELFSTIEAILKERFSYSYLDGINGYRAGFFDESDLQKMRLDQFTWNAIYSYAQKNRKHPTIFTEEVLRFGKNISSEKEREAAQYILQDYFSGDDIELLGNTEFQKVIFKQRNKLSDFDKAPTGNCRTLSGVTKTLFEYGMYQYHIHELKKVDYIHLYEDTDGYNHTLLTITFRDGSTKQFDPSAIIIGREFRPASTMR